MLKKQQKDWQRFVTIMTMRDDHSDDDIAKEIGLGSSKAVQVWLHRLQKRVGEDVVADWELNKKKYILLSKGLDRFVPVVEPKVEKTPQNRTPRKKAPKLEILDLEPGELTSIAIGYVKDLKEKNPNTPIYDTFLRSIIGKGKKRARDIDDAYGYLYGWMKANNIAFVKLPDK